MMPLGVGMCMPLEIYLVDFCGYTEEEAAEEMYHLFQEMNEDLDQIYHSPTEEERIASLLLMDCPLAV